MCDFLPPFKHHPLIHKTNPYLVTSYTKIQVQSTIKSWWTWPLVLPCSSVCDPAIYSKAASRVILYNKPVHVKSLFKTFLGLLYFMQKVKIRGLAHKAYFSLTSLLTHSYLATRAWWLFCKHSQFAAVQAITSSHFLQSQVLSISPWPSPLLISVSLKLPPY